MNYDMKRSGAYIQSLRIQNEYTQNELAKAMNINQSSLSRIEIGSKGCSVDLFIQFSEFFHVSLDALILGADPDATREAERNMRLKADITELINQLTLLKNSSKQSNVQWAYEYGRWTLANKGILIYNRIRAKPMHLDNFTPAVRITTRTDVQCAP